MLAQELPDGTIDICEKAETDISVAFSLKNRGLERLIQHGLEFNLDDIEELLNGKVPDMEIRPADESLCGSEKYLELDPGQRCEICPGTIFNIPSTVYPDKYSGQGIAQSDCYPAKTKITNIKNKFVLDKEVSVKCNEDRLCAVTIGVEQGEISANLDSRSLDGKNDFGKVDGLSIRAHDSSEKQPLAIEFRAQFDSNGKLEDLIQLPDNFISAVFGRSGLSIGIENVHSFSELEQKIFEYGGMNNGMEIQNKVKDGVDREIEEYERRNSGQKMPLEDQLQLGRELLEDLGGRGAAENIGQAFKDGSAVFMEKHLNTNPHMKMILLGLMQASWRSKNSDYFNMMASSILTPILNKSLKSKLEQILEYMPTENSIAPTTFPIVKLQDLIDNSQITAGMGEMLQFMDKKANYPATPWGLESFIKDVSKTKTKVSLGHLEKLRDELKDRLEKIVEWEKGGNARPEGDQKKRVDWKRLHQDAINLINNLLPEIKEKIEEKNREYGMFASIKGFSTSAERINFILSGCPHKCLKKDKDPVTIPKRDDIEYDLAVATNIGTINTILKRLKEENTGFFEFCIVETKVENCSSTLLGVKHRISLEEAPKLEWDESNKNLILVLENFTRDSSFAGVPGLLTLNKDVSHFRIPIKLEVSADGKIISSKIDGKEIQAGAKLELSNRIFSLATTSISVAVGAGVQVLQTIVHDQAIKKIKDKITKFTGEGIDVTDNDFLENVSLDISDGEIAVYARLKD